MFDDAKHQAWMTAMAGGDRQAFEALYQDLAGPVGGFLYRMCYDEALAEDCLQEAFLKVWKHAPVWRGKGKVSTFVFQIAKTTALDALARQNRRSARVRTGGPSEDGSDLGAVEPVDQQPGPQSQLHADETRRQVREAIAALPEDQRVLVQLIQTEGLTYKEAAAILEVPLGTVKSRMSAAAETLRRRLKDLL